MLLAELLAHPVHPGPDGNGEDEIDRIFQRADQRLAEESHHGHHNGLARQKGEQIAFLVKVRDAEGQMQERRGREGQDRQHEEGGGVHMADPLLGLFQLFGTRGQLPEKALDHPPPEQEHHRAACGHTEPAVDEAKKSAVGRDIEGHDGDEGQRRKNGFHHRQQDRDQRPQPFKAL